MTGDSGQEKAQPHSRRPTRAPGCLVGHGRAADGPPVGRDAPAVSGVAVTLHLRDGGTGGVVVSTGRTRASPLAASAHSANDRVAPRPGIRERASSTVALVCSAWAAQPSRTPAIGAAATPHVTARQLGPRASRDTLSVSPLDRGRGEERGWHPSPPWSPASLLVCPHPWVSPASLQPPPQAVLSILPARAALSEFNWDWILSDELGAQGPTGLTEEAGRTRTQGVTRGKHGPDRDTWTQKGANKLTRTLAVKVSPVIHSRLTWAASSAPGAPGPPSPAPPPWLRGRSCRASTSPGCRCRHRCTPG